MAKQKKPDIGQNQSRDSLADFDPIGSELKPRDVVRLINKMIKRGEGWAVIDYINDLHRLGVKVDFAGLTETLAQGIHPNQIGEYVARLTLASGAVTAVATQYDEQSQPIGFVRDEPREPDQRALAQAFGEIFVESWKYGLTPNDVVRLILSDYLQADLVHAGMRDWIPLLVQYCDKKQLAQDLVEYGQGVLVLEYLEAFMKPSSVST